MACRSISPHLQPVAAFSRAAVRMVNAMHRAATPFLAIIFA